MAVRLLHMSDVHFGHENGAAVQAASDFARTTPFDLLVISGDLTQTGEQAQFDSASAWLTALPGPRLVTPGNHDTPWAGLVERIARPFARYAQAIGEPARGKFVGTGLAVEALNSARGWQMRLNWSKGAVSRLQVESACAALERSLPDAVRVLLCHHPLLEVRGAPMTARVRGGHYAARRLALAGVDLVLTGHLHAPFAQVLPYGDERTYAVGAGTLSLRERGSPPGFNVLEIDRSEIVVRAMALQGGVLQTSEVWTLPRRTRGSAAPADVGTEP